MCAKQEFTIDASDVITITDASENMTKYYWESIDHLENPEAYKEEEPQADEDGLDQLKEVLTTDVKLILLDNFSLEDLKKAVELTQTKVKLEASGGITFENARKIAQTGVDYLAVGALTHSAPVLDIGGDLRTIS